jgi:hypothetical protein
VGGGGAAARGGGGAGRGPLHYSRRCFASDVAPEPRAYGRAQARRHCARFRSPLFAIADVPSARRRILIDSRDLERLIERWKEVDDSSTSLR